MVYMEPSSLGIEPLYTCWIKKLDEMLVTLAKNNATNAQGGNKEGAAPKQDAAPEKKSHSKKESARQSITKKLTALFKAYIEDLIYFVRKKLKEICPTVDNNLACSVMRIIDTFFDKFRTQEAQFKNMDEDVKKTDAVLEGIFYFACIWGPRA